MMEVLWALGAAIALIVWIEWRLSAKDRANRRPR
jgi:hypothetical protein